MKISRNTSGVSVLEVLIAIGMTGVLIVAIGASQGAIHRLTTASKDRQTTLAYAKESLESLTANAQTLFGCECSTDTCSDTDTDGVLDQCQRTSGDGQTCTLFPGYTSCWTEFADGTVANAPLHLTTAGGTPVLASGSETLAADTTMSRSISIENITADPNRKHISVEMAWTDRGVSKSTQIDTILTAWENL